MDPQRIANKLISDAIERGEMEPQHGVGKPLPDLENDPDWWVRALLEREQLPERHAELDRRRRSELDKAVAAPDLTTARSILDTLNRTLRRWNQDTPASHHFETMSDIWLLGARAGRPAS